MDKLLEIMFCDSSESDGVRSRGAGWHPRAQETWKALPAAMALGDLLREWDLHTGTVSLQARTFGGLRYLSLVEERSLERTWRLGTAESLAVLVGHHSVDRRLLVSLACDLGELILRRFPGENRAALRVLRLVRRFLAGKDWSGFQEAQEALVEPLFARRDLAAYTARYILSAAHDDLLSPLAWLANNTASFPFADGPRVQRSVSYVVRSRVTFSTFCVALGVNSGGSW